MRTLIALIFAFSVSSLVMGDVSGQQSTVSGPLEDPIITRAKQFVSKLSDRDLNGWKQTWSAGSPYYEAAENDLKLILERTLSSTARIIKSYEPTIEGDTATIMLDIEFEGLPAAGQSKLVHFRTGCWTIVLRRERSGWGVFRFISAERAAVIDLLDAADETARDDMITSLDIWSPELTVRALITEANERMAGLTSDQAQSIFALSTRLADRIGNDRATIATAEWIASKYSEFGNFASAVEYASKAVEVSRKLNDPFSTSDKLSSLAIVYLKNGDPAEALSYLKEAAALIDATGNSKQNWINYYRIGHCYLALGDYIGAMSYYEKSKDLLRAANPNDDLAVQKVTIANLFQIQGNYAQAIEYYSQSLAAFEKNMSQYGISISLAGLAEAYGSEGNFEKAIEFEKKALVIRTTMANYVHSFDSLRRLGKYHASMGDITTANTYFQQALELAKSRNSNGQMSSIYLEMADTALRSRRIDIALQAALAAKSHTENDGTTVPNWRVYFIVGRAMQANGRSSDAEQNYNKALQLAEQDADRFAGGVVDKDRSLTRAGEIYVRLAEILIERGKTVEAFSIVERGRSRALLETLKNGKPETSIWKSGPDKAEDIRLRQTMVKLNSQLAQENSRKTIDAARVAEIQVAVNKTRLEFERHQTRALVAHPELRIQTGRMLPLEISEAAQLLPNPRSAIAEFMVAEHKTYVFLITKGRDGNAVLKLFTTDVERDHLAKTIDTYRSKLISGQPDFHKDARDLYNLLLKPAQADLAGMTDLIIVPDGPLWDLPFQTLVNEKSKYLTEQAAISYAPSLTALREMSKKARKRKSDPYLELLAFGNPVVGAETSERVKQVFMSEKLDPLPESERLVNELGKMYGANRSRVYIGQGAREEIAKSESPKYRIVQFATHGILNNLSPMYSHLVLALNARDPNEDGLLEAWEMKDLDLKADMIILSACETARGKISSGEGVIGMTWAMFIAGTPTTVASQWKVESKSTTELMLEFHRQLLSKKVSKAEALRRASLKLLKTERYKHPVYWAGFVLVGDGS